MQGGVADLFLGCLYVDMRVLAGWYLVLVALMMVHNRFLVEGIALVVRQFQISVAWTPTPAF